MLCDRESLLTNSTRCPRVSSMLFGLTPDVVMVTVVEATGVDSVGDVGLELALFEPPHAMASPRASVDARDVTVAEVFMGQF